MLPVLHTVRSYILVLIFFLMTMQQFFHTFKSAPVQVLVSIYVLLAFIPILFPAFHHSVFWVLYCFVTAYCIYVSCKLITIFFRCPQYPTLPSYCKLLTVPGKCCASVVCDIPGYGIYHPVIQLTNSSWSGYSGGMIGNTTVISVPGTIGFGKYLKYLIFHNGIFLPFVLGICIIIVGKLDENCSFAVQSIHRHKQEHMSVTLKRCPNKKDIKEPKDASLCEKNTI